MTNHTSIPVAWRFFTVGGYPVEFPNLYFQCLGCAPLPLDAFWKLGPWEASAAFPFSLLDFHAYFGDANMTDNPLIFFFKAIY